MKRSEIERMLLGAEPEELRRYLASPDQGQLLLSGSTVPAIGARRNVPLPSGLLLLERTDLGGPIEYTGVYTTLAEYAPLEDFDPPSPSIDTLCHAFADGHDRVDIIRALAIVNHLIQDRDQRQQLTQDFRNSLLPERQERFDLLFRSDVRRDIATRQTVLAAMRWALTAPQTKRPASSVTDISAALLLIHALAVELTTEKEREDQTLAGQPARFVMELLRVGLLGEHEDTYAQIDRTIRLWRDYGPRVVAARTAPAEMLRQATGLEPEDFLALGFAFYSHLMTWKLGKPFLVAPDLRIRMDPNKIEAFLSVVATTPDELGAELERSHPRFGFLAIEKHPVLKLEDGFLILDETMLLQRVTNGLYWMVHDAEKAKDDADRLKWTQVYSEMVELMVEDALSSMAPPILGAGTTFYTEEDIGRAYSSGKRCDVAIDFGSTFVLAEVVSGVLSVPTRIEGSVEAFEHDTERLVIKKCRQLDESARLILGAPSVLTNNPAAKDLRIAPLLVVGGGYPVNPLVFEYIREKLRNERLLTDPRIEPLSIIDLGELEMLEGLAEKGHALSEILKAWKSSNLTDIWLRNYILKEFPMPGPDSRPKRMKDKFNVVFDDIIKRLDFIDRPSSAEGE